MVTSDWFAMSDTFVKASIEGVEAPQFTDIHWRAKKGKASWNYRLKFDVLLGTRTRSMKYPYLSLQMWDKSILSWDELIAEMQFDLGVYFKRAFKKKISVMVFDDLLKKKRGKKKARRNPQQTDKNDEVGNSSDQKSVEISNTSLDVAPRESLDRPPSQLSPVAQREKQSSGCGKCCGCICCCCSKPKSSKKRRKKNALPSQDDSDDDEENLLLDAKEREAAEDQKEAAQKVSMIKGLFGLGEDDPPDSHWFHGDKTDHKTGQKLPMGKLCVSCQIIPKAEAMMNDNGFGQNAPNHSPFVPPPSGRLSFSWNPFVMGMYASSNDINLHF